MIAPTLIYLKPAETGYTPNILPFSMEHDDEALDWGPGS